MRFMMKAALGAAFFVLPSCVFAQGAVQQSGPVVSGNAPAWFRNGMIGDSGVSLEFIKSLQAFNPGQTVPNLNIAGALVQGLNTVWSGGLPANNVGLYMTQGLSGTTSGIHPQNFAANNGGVLPINLISISESLNIPMASGAFGIGLDIVHTYGGSLATGARTTMVVDSDFNASMPIITAQYPFLVAFQPVMTADANAGGTSGQSRGASFTIGGYCYITSNATFWADYACEEMDYFPLSGASYDYGVGYKIVNGDVANHHANIHEFAMGMSGDPGTWNVGFEFGDPQGTGGNGFPISSTGIGILFRAGTLGTVLDASAVTGDFLKGPNGFKVSSDNFVHTDRIIPINANSIAFMSTTGNGPMGVFAANSTTPVSYPFLTAGSVVGFDTGGVNSALFIGAGLATAITLAQSGVTTTIAGGLILPALTSGTATKYLCVTSANVVIAQSGPC